MKIKRLVIAGILVPVVALAGITLVVTVYAFILAFKARGAPDTELITRFAESLSRSLWSPLMILLAIPAAALALRKAGRVSVLYGALVGAVAGAAGVVVGFHFNLRALIGFLLTIAAGALGALLSRIVFRKKLTEEIISGGPE